jgi:flagella basal body P-ring formation protein FlgA
VIAGVLLLIVSAGARPAAVPAGPPDLAPVRVAVVEAVRARVGEQAEVQVADLVVRTKPGAGGRLVATPEPDARLTRPIRFSLAERHADQTSTTIGYAVATVRVAIEHARIVRALARGTLISPDDLAVGCAELGALPLRRLPAPADLVGGRAARDLAADEVVTRSMVLAEPLVHSGDQVMVRSTVGPVQVEGRAVAAQNGFRGETIRVVNPDSRKAIRARVVGPGEVEVVR